MIDNMGEASDDDAETGHKNISSLLTTTKGFQMFKH